jgi:peroxiredoxin Q/BCP
MLATGDTAPDFSLPDDRGKIVTLGALLEAGPLILYFYPADFTPLCTREACMIRDWPLDPAEARASIAGVSPDPPATHARFRAEHGLSHVLLSDGDKRVIRSYGVDGPFGFGVRRATFLIDRERRILRAVRADFSLARHRGLIAEALGRRPG